MGDGRRFKAQPKDPKQQQGADGSEKESGNEESSENPSRREGSQDRTSWQICRVMGKQPYCKKPGVQGQGGTFTVYLGATWKS